MKGDLPFSDRTMNIVKEIIVLDETAEYRLNGKTGWESSVDPDMGWFVFRTQLVFGLLPRLFGDKDILVWSLIFFPMLFLRPILAIAIGLSGYGSMGNFRSLQIVLGILFLVPATYTL